MPAAEPSRDARRVLAALATDKCVIIKGVPASGKSLLLGEVRQLFEGGTASGVQSTPHEQVALTESAESAGWLPSPDRDDRRVWQTVMNQNSRYKDFWRGTEPRHDGKPGFQLSEGILYRANEHAKGAKGVSLVTIDELNRGPAVNVFGPSIVAIEADKRASEANEAIPARTVSFELQKADGTEEDYWLSPHLYIVCAQNNADTSVEAIDTAFLRRFVPIELGPTASVLIEHFDLAGIEGELPEKAAQPTDVYRAAVRAWENVNRKLAVGASPDFRLGHGALVNAGEEVPTDSVAAALAYVARGWASVDQHIGEVFYGKADHVAEAYWVNEAGPAHPYKLTTVPFADLDQVVLERDDADLYELLRVIANAG
jgi:5-methylcytosine-specific restriction protein B